MNVLVTGGAGFIGSHLVDELINRGYNVIVVDDLSTGLQENVNNKAQFINLPIQDLELHRVFELIHPEVVYHLAAQTSVKRSMDNPLGDLDTNLKGTLNLLECCKNFATSKIIFSSSAAIYGNPITLPINEGHSPSPISFYGLNKLTAEGYIDIYSRLSKLSYVILRYSNVYGPRQASHGEGGVIANFLDALINNRKPIIYGTGEQTRDFIFVQDVVNANIKGLNTKCNQVLNISSNQSVTIKELLQELTIIMNKDLAPEYAQFRTDDILHSKLNNQKAKEELNWRPVFSLEEGLRLTIADYFSGGGK